MSIRSIWVRAAKAARPLRAFRLVIVSDRWVLKIAAMETKLRKILLGGTADKGEPLAVVPSSTAWGVVVDWMGREGRGDPGIPIRKTG